MLPYSDNIIVFTIIHTHVLNCWGRLRLLCPSPLPDVGFETISTTPSIQPYLPRFKAIHNYKKVLSPKIPVIMIYIYVPYNDHMT